MYSTLFENLIPGNLVTPGLSDGYRSQQDSKYLKSVWVAYVQ